MKVSSTNKFTGELVELPADTPEQIITAWRVAQELERQAKQLKDQLKKVVPSLIGDRGVSDEVDGYMFRSTTIQKYNYSRAALRELLDADTYDLMMKPNKTAIDTYLKENLEELGEKSTLLRNSMEAEGKPYEVIKLERVKRVD